MKNRLLSCGCCKAPQDDAVVENSVVLSESEKEEAALAESIYHDARQSLTPSMVYPPATTASTFTGSLDKDPQALLFSSRRNSVRDSVLVQKLLGKQPIPPPQDGYPGDLTKDELQACLEFRRQLKERRTQEPSYYEMVHCYSGVEDEAFALCRFLRARKFVVNDTFAMMDGNLDAWKAGRSHDFYKDLESTMECPLPIMWTQFPMLHYGIAKNGSFVAYIQVESINLNALDCLTDLENFVAVIWHEFMYGFRDGIEKAKQSHPNVQIRCEMTFVIDLNNISRSLFTEKVMQVLKECCAAFNCFPEILNKMVIVNAPFFFSAMWMVIRKFLDARTVAKIDIYSNASKGKACIARYIAPKELLKDYGGSGPFFDQVLQEMRTEGTLRQIVERFFLPHGGEHTYAFGLESNEKVNVMVYTRSENGANFSLASGKETVAEVLVKGQGGSAKPYSMQVASEVRGPGKFTVSARSASTSMEYFLVVLLVYPN